MIGKCGYRRVNGLSSPGERLCEATVCVITAIAWCITLPLQLPFYAWDYHRQKRYDSTDGRRRWLRKNAVSPLPLPRKRRLSISETKSGPSQRTSAQEKSPFFRLPKEVRLTIYQMAFGYPSVHIAPLSRRLGSVTCCSDHVYCRLMCFPKNDNSRYGMIGHEGYSLPGVRVLPVLKACRRMYSEAIYVLYAWRTFRFHKLDAIMATAVAIPPQYFRSIKSLVLDPWGGLDDLGTRQYHVPYITTFRERQGREATHESETSDAVPTAWEATCEVLASMKSLRRLRIRMHQGCGYSLEDEEILFGPLRRLHSPEFFEVEVDWAETETFQKGDAPFTVRRILSETRIARET
ncbi:hypothetical protein AJ80_09056 [Polytolypa hystricis UAMH7299]|uniref:DUF7730 domain-containing protein n=1 Tax=Polytolypa hystricis (strain UAMH7299) TaxID=1447883 RepID=A0A2B7WXD8_POLH7|nr:hypothetical protein AJ80_09056 [Polytolypa hystricis UAMH7299]